MWESGLIVEGCFDKHMTMSVMPGLKVEGYFD